MAINATYGFNAGQVVERIRNYVGNAAENTDFIQYVQDTVNLAQLRFANAHDWAYLLRTNLPLNITNGTKQYELDIANVGVNIKSTNVKVITNPENNARVNRIDLQTLRSFDPDKDEGSVGELVTHWAEVGDQRIELYPPNFKDQTLEIDAKVEITLATNFDSTADVAVDTTARLDIPVEYQESFIELALAMVLDRENDDRAVGKMQSAREMVKENIRTDIAKLGSTISPRLKHWSEVVESAANELDPLDWYNRE